jgi:hypothetical protein
LEFWQKPTAKQGWTFDPPKPWVVYWGLVDRRLDYELIEQLAAARIGTVLLVGPEDDADQRLKHLANVVMAGPLPPDQLPALATEAAVLIMPYADLPVTRAIQPLKLKEYLATGKPVVARKLPATQEWADSLDLADQPGPFVQSVQLRLSTGTTTSQASARQRLANETWKAKSDEFFRFITH